MSARKNGASSNRFDELEKRISYGFSDQANLELAFTHASSRKSVRDGVHYERLEFLGDRVLGLCIAEQIFTQYPTADEGELSLRLNALVKGKTLAEISDKLKLHQFVEVGDDLRHLTGKRMQSVRADILEALIASIYLDGGISAAKEFVGRFWSERILDETTARRDSKTALQEWSHSLGKGTPEYVETDRTGPDHDPVFYVSVAIESLEPSTGSGRSKRLAEQDAARKMLYREEVWSDQSQEGDAE